MNGTDLKQSLGAKPLMFPTPVLMVGSYDENDRPNLMNAAWGGICCSQPPCVAVSLRASRHTYGNIVARNAFTVGIACEERMAEADYAGMVSGRDVDKFAATGLTAVRSELVDAPFAAEFPVVLECRLLQVVELGVHHQFIGEILDVKADRNVLDDDGLPDIMRIRPLAYDPAHKGYHGITPLLGTAFSVGKGIAG